MATRKLTNCTDETSVSGLFSNDVVFGIPYFQRPYKWTDANISRFVTDLATLLDYEDTSHFLGAVIIFQKNSNPSEPDYYEVIDGQQRLTTCYLSLLALTKIFTKYDMVDDAIGLYERYLLVLHKTKNITNAKLISCKEDRAGMNRVFYDLMSNSEFYKHLQTSNHEYKQMPNTGNQEGRIWKNYKTLCKFFENSYIDNEKNAEDFGKKVLLTLYDKLVNSMRVVQIVVNDPTDGPKIFDSLNSKQHPMTIGDLVRNEVFAKIADKDDDEIDILDRDYWHPFYEKFRQKNNDSYDKVFESFFFPYVLTLNHSVKKADAFNYLRGQWSTENSSKEIIQSLAKYQDIFIDLHYGTNLTQCGEDIKLSIRRFALMDAPTSIYPFIMHVVRATIDNRLDEELGISILDQVESFLVRRIVCGYEPTGLHATFKSLWDDCEGNYSVDNVVKNIRKHFTVKWPDDKEFEQNIKNRSLYTVKATPYLLAEWNGHLGGDIPELDSQQIEHVLPETPDQDSQWLKDWSEEEFNNKVHCLANLLPISGSLNASIQNSDYVDKRERYLKDSALKAPRDFANKYKKWTPSVFEDRAQEIAKWALERWKY